MVMFKTQKLVVFAREIIRDFLFIITIFIIIFIFINFSKD